MMLLNCFKQNTAISGVYLTYSQHSQHLAYQTKRSNHPEVFLGKAILKIYSKFTGEHPHRRVISVKLQSKFIEITPLAWVFSCKFAAYFQNTFF